MGFWSNLREYLQRFGRESARENWERERERDLGESWERERDLGEIRERQREREREEKVYEVNGCFFCVKYMWEYDTSERERERERDLF